MAKIPISKLPKATIAGAIDEVPVVQDGVTKKVAIEDIGKEVNEAQEYSDLESTDKTIIGAINEISSSLESKAEANSVYTKEETYSKTEVDTNLARQVHDIVVEELEDNGASETGYDNTKSGLEATNVQDAIDEVNEKASSLPSDVYTKAETDALLADKADAATLEADYYDKAETDAMLADKADASALGDFYTKSETNTKLSGKADKGSVYTTAQVNTLLGDKADKSDLDNYYTKSQANSLLNDKANKANVYDKNYINDVLGQIDNAFTDVNTALGQKANSADVYNKTYIDTALSAKADANNVYTKSEVNNLVGGLIDDESTADNKTWSSEKIDEAIDSVENTVNELDTSLQGIEDITLVMPINLLNVNDPDFVLDKKLATTSGVPVDATNSFSTGFIPIVEGKTYNWIYGPYLSTSQVITRICAYGSDKAYKSSYTQDGERGFAVPVGSGIAYIRFSGNKANLPPAQQNVMFTEGFPDRYYPYHAPYNSYSVKNSALDADFIRNLGGEIERIYPDWELGTFDNSWRLSDSTNTIRTDYIPVADRLEISVASGCQAKIYPISLSGKQLEIYPRICTDTITITSEDAKFIRIGYSATTPETITDPNTYGLGVTIIRYGTDKSFNTKMTANPNAQTVDPSQVLPQYLALVAVKEKHEASKIDVTVGYLYRTVLAPYKFYYAQGKPENIKYLCDWDTSLAGASHNTPIWYCFGMTDEGDIICVHRGEIESVDRARDYPIVYPHTDYNNPVKVMLTGTLPTSWISNSGDYAESGHFYFGEYIRSVHTHAYVWEVTAPYTNVADWNIIKTYERDIDPTDPSSMVLGKIEHIHHVSRDPFSNVLYVTTGDHWTEARIDYYKDNAWGVLAEGDEEVCRQLNFIYTPTYVYWASDAFAIYDPETQEMVGGAHKFFRATRDANGLIDIENLESFEIPYFMSSVATYHTAYIAEPECILVLDRIDKANPYAELPFHVWNIKEEKFELSGVAKQARGSINQYLGFRCECCQHYPNLYDSKVSVGFSLYPNSIDVCDNPCPNINPSQGGNTSDDSVNANQVNSMTVEVRR